MPATSHPSYHLYVAINDNDLTTVKALEDIEAFDDHGHTPLLLAAMLGRVEIVEHLIARGADVGATTKDGSTALHIASRYGYTKILEMLLSAGADMEASDMYGQTPLHSAVGYRPAGSQKETIACARLLRACDAKVGIRDNYGRSPLFLAARHGKTALVKLLLAEGADVSLVDKNCDTPLDKAEEYNHTKTAALLREAMAATEQQAA